MIKFIELLIDAILVWITAYYVGKISLNVKQKVGIKEIITIVLFSIILALLSMTNLEIYYGTIKIIGTYALECIFYKILFKESLSKVMAAALLYYLCIFLSEIIVVVTVGIFTNLIGEQMQFMKNNIIMNLLITLSSCIIAFRYKNAFSQFIKNSTKNNLSYFIIIILILLTIALLFFKIPFDKWSINPEYIITMTILLCFCIIGIYLIKQKSDIEKASTMYQKVVEYSKTTNKLLEDYRIVNHEHKNQLSIIRQMANKENKKLIEYLDNLLDNKNVIKYQWISSLNNLPLEGLKGLFNYKLLEMENNGINPIVNISREVSRVKLNSIDTKIQDNLYSIVGIYLDNAIEAASKSKDKRISLDIYKEKKELVMIIGNTYKGKINLEKLDDYGYTTKGKNHGIGLYIVKNIIDRTDVFFVNRSIINDHYVQELRLNFSKINNSKIKKKKTTK